MRKFFEIKKIFSQFVILVFAIGFFSTMQLNIAFAAKFNFTPASTTFANGCVASVDLMADATGESSNAADVEISFDPDDIEIISVDEGDAYEAYLGLDISNAEGRIRFTGASFVNMHKSNKVFLTIKFQPKVNTTQANFIIKFTTPGDTLDSNIASSITNDDLLTSITNASYTFSSTDRSRCGEDRTPPAVDFIYPKSLSSNVPANSSLKFRVTDDISGVDLETIGIVFNGVDYTTRSSSVGYSGSNLDYLFEVFPTGGIKVNETNSLIVSGSDLSGNNFKSQIVFNLPEEICEDTQPTECLYDDLESDPLIDESANSTIKYDEVKGCVDISKSALPVEAIIKATNILSDFKNNNPLVGHIINYLVSPTGKSTLATALLFLTLLPLLTFGLGSPGLLLEFFDYLTGGSARRRWGIVIDQSTGKPVTFAICRLYSAGTKNIADQTLSDNEGRYGFPITGGSYRMEISKSGYEVYSSKVIIEDNQPYLQDVYLINKDLKAHMNRTRRSFDLLKNLLRIYRKLLPFIFTFGFVISVANLIYNFNIFNLLVFVFYMSYLLISLVSRINLRAQYSSIVDSKSVLRVPNALVKIFDPQTGALVDTKLTNFEGYFDFWGKSGTYLVSVSIRGYKFPSEVQTDLKKSYLGDNQMLEIALNHGHNNLHILVDPI